LAIYEKDIQAHIDSCLHCQVPKKSTAKPTPLQPLPTVDQPNQHIHIDLFGPLKTSEQGNKMVLVMTDAFTKYAEAIAIPNKEAETVAMEIFIHWICRFGSPVQIHSDNGTEFVNKLNKELFKLLDIKHTTKTPGHPQCNAQAEVFNKTMAKYLASFVHESTLDWEQYLPALQFFYNTSYHSTISTTPFELLYVMKSRTPTIPGQDVQRKFDGESFAAERLQILQKAKQTAKEQMDEKLQEYKKQHDKNAKDHDFSMGQKVWYLETNFLGKNKKLVPKYCGPAITICINKSVAKLKTEKHRLKTINVNKLKHFFPGDDSNLDADAEADAETKQSDLVKFDPTMQRPLTRAWSKLTKSDAISALVNKTDSASSEEIWYKLNSIAYKLYHLNLEFNQLTSEELKFWKQFKQEDIFEWLSGSPIHPLDYSEYIRICSTITEDRPVQQAQQQVPQPAPEPQPGPAPEIPVPGPSPRKPGRPPG
jgi:hypothetical protein